MNHIRVQGAVFSVLACLGCLGSAFLPPLDPSTALLFVAAAIVVLGVPHGALDTIFARELYGLSGGGAWLRFGFVYLSLAGAVVALWFYLPLLFLLGFLLISIAHFSGDPEGEVAWVIRLLHGGAIIFLPLLRYPDEISALFALLAGSGAGAALVPWLSLLALPWVLGLVAAVGYLAWRRSWLAVELASLGLLAVVAPPLISFAIFFCTMHSARHIIRSARYSSQSSPRLMIAASLLPMALVAVLGGASWYLLRDQPLDQRLVQIIFVGLAALTVPHMALVERIRLRGWIRGPAPRKPAP